MPISFIISIIPTILDDKAKGWTISCIRWKSSQSKSQVSAEPPTFHGQPLKSTIFQWLNHVKSQFLRLKPWFFRYFPWWNQGFHLIFHGFPWLNPAFSLVEWGTHSFPWLNPPFFPWSTPPFFERWSPRIAQRSAVRPGATSMPWRRSFQKRREGTRPKRRRRRWENVGNVDFFHGFSIGFCHDK